MVYIELDRVLPVMVMIGWESVPQGAIDDELLLEAESLAEAAMGPVSSAD